MLAIIKILPPLLLLSCLLLTLLPNWSPITCYSAALFCSVFVGMCFFRRSQGLRWRLEYLNKSVGLRMMKREEMKGRAGGRVRLQLHDSQGRFSQLSRVRNNS